MPGAPFLIASPTTDFWIPQVTSYVAETFFVCAGMFGALAAFGTLTKRNLTGVGQFMFMGLIGLVIASLVGIFWQNDLLWKATTL